MTYKIIGDSCLDLPRRIREDPHFQMIPLTLQVGSASIVDDETFDQKKSLANRRQPARSAPRLPARLQKVLKKLTNAMRECVCPSHYQSI